MSSKEEELKEQSELISKVIKLKDLVHYQQGAVVSRTLLDRRTGTVTAFAFARGQALSEHISPFDAILQILEGKVEVTIGGEPIFVEEGEMVILPANIPHAVKAPVDLKMLLIMLRSERRDENGC